LSNSQVLFLYTAPSTDNTEAISSISISEVENQSTISISIKANRIMPVSSKTVEEWLVRLYELVLSFVKCAVAAGSEIGLEPTRKTMAENAELLVSSFTNAFWVILPNDLLPDLPSDVEVVSLSNNSSILCREFVSSWFHG